MPRQYLVAFLYVLLKHSSRVNIANQKTPVHKWIHKLIKNDQIWRSRAHDRGSTDSRDSWECWEPKSSSPGNKTTCISTLWCYRRFSPLSMCTRVVFQLMFLTYDQLPPSIIVGTRGKLNSQHWNVAGNPRKNKPGNCVFSCMTHGCQEGIFKRFYLFGGEACQSVCVCLSCCYRRYRWQQVIIMEED